MGESTFSAATNPKAKSVDKSTFLSFLVYFVTLLSAPFKLSIVKPLFLNAQIRY